MTESTHVFVQWFLEVSKHHNTTFFITFKRKCCHFRSSKFSVSQLYVFRIVIILMRYVKSNADDHHFTRIRCVQRTFVNPLHGLLAFFKWTTCVVNSLKHRHTHTLHHPCHNRPSKCLSSRGSGAARSTSRPQSNIHPRFRVPERRLAMGLPVVSVSPQHGWPLTLQIPHICLCFPQLWTILPGFHPLSANQDSKFLEKRESEFLGVPSPLGSNP